MVEFFEGLKPLSPLQMDVEWLEMSLRRRDVEQWMKHRHLPEDLRSKVRDSKRYNWAATQGVNEENLMEHLPEDLQRDIRRNIFKFLKTRFSQKMDEPILDAIDERLRQMVTDIAQKDKNKAKRTKPSTGMERATLAILYSPIGYGCVAHDPMTPNDCVKNNQD
ncbi:probable cyclic nucleotide-gated ion channel 20, chloroplastic isoform X1 [Tanacetum coccineum]